GNSILNLCQKRNVPICPTREKANRLSLLTSNWGVFGFGYRVLPRVAAIASVAPLSLLTVLTLCEGQRGWLTAEFRLCSQIVGAALGMKLWFSWLYGNLVSYVWCFAVSLVEVLQLA
ncbi:MAG TPA: hypothetical protein VN456_04255, partial [Desulfosporosinus sp.]|nr:hypothetical protein [Desulfosporosinus sp.]